MNSIAPCLQALSTSSFAYCNIFDFDRTYCVSATRLTEKFDASGRQRPDLYCLTLYNQKKFSHWTMTNRGSGTADLPELATAPGKSKRARRRVTQSIHLYVYIDGYQKRLVGLRCAAPQVKNCCHVLLCINQKSLRRIVIFGPYSFLS